MLKAFTKLSLKKGLRNLASLNVTSREPQMENDKPLSQVTEYNLGKVVGNYLWSSTGGRVHNRSISQIWIWEQGHLKLWRRAARFNMKPAQWSRNKVFVTFCPTLCSKSILKNDKWALTSSYTLFNHCHMKCTETRLQVVGGKITFTFYKQNCAETNSLDTEQLHKHKVTHIRILQW